MESNQLNGIPWSADFGRNTMLGGAWKLAALFKEQGPSNFHWEFDLMEEESHGSIPHQSTYKGLEFIFSDWRWDNKRDLLENIGIAAFDDYEKTINSLYGLTPKWNERQLINAGQVFIRKEQPEKAIPIYTKAAELFPDSESIWFQYGHALGKAEKKEEAKTAFNKILEINPENMQAKAALKELGAATDIPDIQYTDEQLAKYAGTYDLNIGFSVTMDVENQKLWVTPPDQPREALTPIGEHAFYVKSIDAKLTFELENGVVVGFTGDSPQGQISAKKQ